MVGHHPFVSILKLALVLGAEADAKAGAKAGANAGANASANAGAGASENSTCAFQNGMTAF